MTHPAALYIDGRFIGSEPGRPSEPILNPATGESLGDLPHATDAELDEAVAAATRTFPVWSRTDPAQRSAVLRKAGQLLRERAAHIALTLVREQGKPLAEAQWEVAESAAIFDWNAEEGRRIYGRTLPRAADGPVQVVRQDPVGPCLLLTPWNFPVLTPVRKIAASLAAGCTSVVKASEETPGSAVEIMRALHDAGLPAGCVNLVFGVPARVSQRLMAHKAIRKVSFTGSTAVGVELMKLAAETVKRTTMELGGNAPVIVCEDADLESAVSIMAGQKFRNAGQVCVSPARFFVHESLYDGFVAGVGEKIKTMRIGNGEDAATEMGPLANARRRDAMEEIVADAQARGATVRSMGSVPNQGFFFAPTIVTGLDGDSRLETSETFGPIMPIRPFADLDDAIGRANSVEAGLAGFAFTRSMATARRLADEVEVGMLGINTIAISTPATPFGGVKQSGFGSEGGMEGVQAFLDTRLVVQG